jgi:hypothetical protein
MSNEVFIFLILGPQLIFLKARFGERFFWGIDKIDRELEQNFMQYFQVAGTIPNSIRAKAIFAYV